MYETLCFDKILSIKFKFFCIRIFYSSIKKKVINLIQPFKISVFIDVFFIRIIFTHSTLIMRLKYLFSLLIV